MSTGTDAARTIAAGVAFLRAAQRPTGELRIMKWLTSAPNDLLLDPSVFGTALILNAIGDVPGAEDVRERALDFLESEMERHGVWRHWSSEHPQFRHIPPDLDDTANASLALARHGRRAPQNRALLLANRDPRGLFFTWITPRLRMPLHRPWLSIALRQLRRPVSNVYFFRLTSARRHDVDAVVNANVLTYLGSSPETAPAVQEILRILRERRETTCDKWYDNEFVIWYFFSRALRAAGAEEGGATIVERIRRAAPSNALEWALAALALLDWNADASEAADAILRAQLPSGAWPCAGLYQGGLNFYRWGSDEVTTGFCLGALARWSALTSSTDTAARARA